MTQRRRARTLRAALVGTVIATVVAGTAAPALAVPPPPPNPTDQQIGSAAAAREAAAAEVGRIAGLVAAAEAELEKLGVQAEAAGMAYLAAEEALHQAQARAQETAAGLAAAAEQVSAAEARIAMFSRDSYMNGAALTSSAALLDSEGPGELIQRAAMLDYVADNQLDVLGQLEIARVQQANADSAARAARDEMAAAEQAAAAAKQEADNRLAAQQTAVAQVEAQKLEYDAQLQAAQIRLLELQGARNAYEQWMANKLAEEAAAREAAERAAAEAAAAAAAARNQNNGGGGGGGGAGGSGGGGGWVRPTSGYISSCYGWRWGALHGGVDIAAPIGTPVYAAHSGRVVRSGSASGFGLAIYIQGDDGSVTVYGHVNREFVSAGERVSVGDVIAEVGNRGQSTGPHLHFEVHPSGSMYSGSVNPAPWLRARGVAMERC
jgi:murein DD-endopeptidase MepM/ murein hydrolase activator NlpD